MCWRHNAPVGQLARLKPNLSFDTLAENICNIYLSLAAAVGWRGRVCDTLGQTVGLLSALTLCAIHPLGARVSRHSNMPFMDIECFGFWGGDSNLTWFNTLKLLWIFCIYLMSCDIHWQNVLHLHFSKFNPLQLRQHLQIDDANFFFFFFQTNVSLLCEALWAACLYRKCSV